MRFRLGILSLILVVLWSSVARADSFSFPDFSSVAGLQLNGSAVQAGSALRLTDTGEFFAVGSAFTTSTISVTGGFTMIFRFQIDEGALFLGSPGDGFAFVIQKSAPTALGDSGGNLGYGGIPNSDFGDPMGQHVGVQSCGVSANTANHTSPCNLGGPVVFPKFSNGLVHTVRINYVPGTLTVLFDNGLVSSSVDLGALLDLGDGRAHLGFTASTGAATERVRIINWFYTSEGAAGPTNDLFIASSSTGHVIRLDGSTGTTVYDVPESNVAIALVKGPDGALYVSTHDSPSSVIRVDRATGAPLGVFASGGGLSGAAGVAFGPDGNLYVGSRFTSSVIRYNGSIGGFIDTFVASGSGGLSGTEALLFGPDGNLYVTTDSFGNRVLRYNGVTGAFLGVFATAPSLSGAQSMIFGPDGHLYVAGNSSNNVVRFNGSTGAFKDVFASGIPGANGLAFGPDGNLYVARQGANKISRFNGTSGAFIGDFRSVTGPFGIMFDMFDVRLITTVAGGGTPTPGFCGDGGPATSACLNFVTGVAADASGNVFIADFDNHRIRRVDAVTGIITTVAGGGDPTLGFCGDGGPATDACLNNPTGVAVDASGNVFIADFGNHRIRRVDAVTGMITTVAGGGMPTPGFCGDGGRATSACLNTPTGVAVDAAGNLSIADRVNHRIRRVDATTGMITTVAGKGTSGFCGDGGLATRACLTNPSAVAVNPVSGSLLIGDTDNHRVRLLP